MPPSHNVHYSASVEELIVRVSRTNPGFRQSCDAARRALEKLDLTVHAGAGRRAFQYVPRGQGVFFTVILRFEVFKGSPYAVVAGVHSFDTNPPTRHEDP